MTKSPYRTPPRETGSPERHRLRPDEVVQHLKNVERTILRHFSSSSSKITTASEANKAGDYPRKVYSDCSLAFPGFLCPSSGPYTPFQLDGFDEVTGIQFRSAVFETLSGCFESTYELLKFFAKRVAGRQGIILNRDLSHFYETKLFYLELQRPSS